MPDPDHKDLQLISPMGPIHVSAHAAGMVLHVLIREELETEPSAEGSTELRIHRSLTSTGPLRERGQSRKLVFHLTVYHAMEVIHRHGVIIKHLSK